MHKNFITYHSFIKKNDNLFKTNIPVKFSLNFSSRLHSCGASKINVIYMPDVAIWLHGLEMSCQLVHNAKYVVR